MTSNPPKDLPDQPLVTYHLITFNRLPLLKNLLKSFEFCNVYPKFEWIIADYGSTDGTREFLNDIGKNDRRLVILLRDENDYLDHLRSLSLEPKNRRQKLTAIAGRFCNEVRAFAKGDLLFNLSDDHQFIRKGDWVRDLISIYNHRAQAVHCDDIAGITARGISFARSFKRNNEVLPVKKPEEEVEYFIYKQKTFDVYSFMKRSTFQKVGPFWEIEKATDPSKIEMWRNGKKSMDAYSDYCERTKKLGLKRVALKFPYLAEFTNDINICRMDFPNI